MSAVAGPQGGALARRALRPAAVLAVGSASSFLVYLDATIVNIAFPDVRASFEGATLAGLSWILSAYAIVFAALLVPGGPVRRRGRRAAAVPGGARRVHRRLAAVRDRSVRAAARRRAVLQAAGGAMLVPVRPAARDGGVSRPSSA